MKTMEKYIWKSASALVLLFAMQSCQQEEFVQIGQNGKGFTIQAISENMLEQQVTTRSAIAKNEAEKKIHNLYLFFLDKDGNYLETTNENLFKGYWTPGEGVTVLNIPKDVFVAPTKATNATVYALANVAQEVIADNDNDGFPDNFKADGNQTTLQKLEAFIYAPGNYDSYNRPDITQLPTIGMPMIGKMDNVNLTQSQGSATIELKALMARIDINISIDSEHSNASGTLPRLSMAEWWVTNMPTVVPFTIPADISNLGNNKLDIDPIPNNETIGNHNGTISLSFYIFENLQNPQGTVNYPEGISEEDKQRWKPELAGEDAAAFHFKAFYSTYNDVDGNATYEASFTFYLGANHTDNFKVARNRHYNNNITITGLTQVGNNPDHITFDARVDIAEQSNPFFISMLRERDHDAHFCVTPMDIYLFKEESNPSMTISIEDADTHPWIRMEKIPASDMQSGELTGESANKQLKTGVNYHSGHGKRKYFTTNLMTELAPNTNYNVGHRDRIYFYLDENLSTSDRSATILITYKDDEITRERSIEIVQHGLLEVHVPDDPETRFDESQTIYVEAYEEYLEHYDPLDEHLEPEQMYEGLYWSSTDFYMGGQWRPNSKWTEVYYNGDEATQKIIEETGDNEMKLNEKPNTAAEYCYNKNKRDEKGEVATMKWFLPGIRQLEAILTTYYNQYPEFQEHFYWSSSAAKRNSFGYEDNSRARATKALSGTNYAESDHYQWYTGESGIYGNADRQTYLRIRAARTDLNPQ